MYPTFSINGQLTDDKYEVQFSNINYKARNLTYHKI